MIRKKSISSVLLSWLIVFAISISILSVPERAQAAGISLSASNLTLYKGYSSKLSLKGGTAATTWKTSNKNVVSISKKTGKQIKLTGKKKGTAKITARLNGVTYTCVVKVSNPSLNVSYMNLSFGQQSKLTFGGVKNKNSKIVTYKKLKKQKNNANTIYWAVKNTSVLSIVKKNKKTVTVVPKKLGSTYVYARYKGKNYRCLVSITRKNAAISATSMILTVKGKKTLTLTGLNSADSVTWTSSNPAVATVTASGYTTTVTGNKAGTAIITGRYANTSYSCKVDVRTDALVPSYFESEVAASVKQFNTNKSKSGSSSISSFIYMTDSHWGDNAKNSPGIASYIAKKLSIPFVIFGGDVITNRTDSKDTAKALIDDFYSRFSVPVISTTGNHDLNDWLDKESAGALSDDDLYNWIYSKEKSYLNLKVNVDLNGYVSYTDDTANKVRYITFYYDSYSYPSIQTRNWISSKVKELGSGWTVMLFSHAFFTIESPVPATPDYGTYSTKLKDYFLDLDANSSANIAAWMVGHVHRDYHCVLSNSDDTASINIISTNCDAYRQSAVWGGLTMTAGTSTEQVFDLVQVDTSNKKLYLTRVGAGSDRSVAGSSGCWSY